MNYILQNELLKLEVCDAGAELHSIQGKQTNTEFLWNGNAEYWKYHSPILFPIVGKVLNNKYTVNGTTYELPQHGLARISNFEKIAETESSISFRLNYSKDTLKVYPFKFSLEITYTLQNSTVNIEYKVINIDDKEIYFSIGAHPAFMCPILENENFEDYYFEFEKKETKSIMELSPLGYFTHNEIPYLNNENIIPLTSEVFKNDALVFYDLNSRIINLKSKNHNKYVEFNFKNFPHLGLWSKPTGAPFVCIEPWFGHADFVDFNADFKEKAGIIKLNINKSFKCDYNVTIHE
ncbi:Galactose mutarotase [Clostridium cavendishii DSM 21758]|uniref:Galactose mutarotase n=1 Tax=Clostridium cavendishii DSM 21758 TaxID=1121302 RepID=A0A1M6TSR0_9CLOT|nr:aldose 1-epimerase family protein [Clostridium cavendishii]SHK59946.1 Galactose mutarotase [Clostridium cavendishii DSM 21758]